MNSDVTANHRRFHQRVGAAYFVVSLAPAGRGPALPAFTPDHKALVIPNELSDNVSLFSLESLTVEAVIPLREGSRPWQAKVLPSGELAYVTNSRFSGDAASSTREPSTVSIIDLRSRSVVNEIEVGAGANGVTVDQRGRFGYVANMRSNSVSVIDVQTHCVIRTIPVSKAPAFAKLSRDIDGRLLVVTHLEDAALSIIDTKRFEVIEVIETGTPSLHDSFPQWGPGDTTGVAITDQDIAFVTNYRSHTIAIVDLNRYTIEKIASPIAHPFFVEVDRNDSIVAFSSGAAKKFALMNSETREWIGTFANDGSEPIGSATSDLNIWMTEPDKDRLTAILPGGFAGIARNWDRNMVTKFM